MTSTHRSSWFPATLLVILGAGADVEDLAGINIRVNQDTSGLTQGEGVIVVNPSNPLHLVGAATDYRTGPAKGGFYRSVDGGQTWTDGLVPEPTYLRQSNTAIAFCADSSLVYSSLSYNTFPVNAVFVHRSTDGGQTWPTGSAVVNYPAGWLGLDKPWIACDATASSFSNRVYAVYRDAPNSIRLKWSGDSGSSWSPFVALSDEAQRIKNGVVVSVGRAGQVYVTWIDFANLTQFSTAP